MNPSMSSELLVLGNKFKRNYGLLHNISNDYREKIEFQIQCIWASIFSDSFFDLSELRCKLRPGCFLKFSKFMYWWFTNLSLKKLSKTATFHCDAVIEQIWHSYFLKNVIHSWAIQSNKYVSLIFHVIWCKKQFLILFSTLISIEHFWFYYVQVLQWFWTSYCVFFSEYW